jgi:cytochrome c-type biogenesis protein CcmH/NrfG
MEKQIYHEQELEEPETNTDIGDFAISSAQYFIKNEDYTKARTFLKIALEMDPNNPDALAMLAWAEFQSRRKEYMQQTAQSKKMLKKAMSLDNANARAFLYLRKITALEEKEEKES